MTELALRHWLHLVCEILVEERAADEISAEVVELTARGSFQGIAALRVAGRRRRVRAMLLRARIATLAR